MDHFLDHLHLNRLRSLPGERRWKHPSTPLPCGLQSSSGSTSLVLVCLGPLPTPSDTLSGFLPPSLDASSQAPHLPPRPGPPSPGAGAPQVGLWVLRSSHGMLSSWGPARAPRYLHLCVSNPDLSPKHTPDSQPLSFTCTWICQRHSKSVHPNIPPQPLPTPSPGLPTSARLPVSIQQGHGSHTSLGSALLLSPLPHVQTTTNPLDIAS